jgi:hypothetical protein
MDTQPEGAEQVDYSMEEDDQPLASESHKFVTTQVKRNLNRSNTM